MPGHIKTRSLPVLLACLLSACGGSSSETFFTTTPPISTMLAITDTGISLCADYAYTDTGTGYNVTGSTIHNNNLDCNTQAVVPTLATDGFETPTTGGDIIRGGQDALYGLDATNNNATDGHAGFSYTQLDTNGNPLAIRSSDYSVTPWACVKDNVTGLTWEVKTSDGLQHKDYRYTWYNSTNSNDGGEHGLGDTGFSTTTGLESLSGNYTGSDQCEDFARCDTEKYIADINASNAGTGLCGSTNWRMPNRHELLSIVNNNITGPAIDTGYFPNLNPLSIYWTSSSLADTNFRVYAWSINFFDGSVNGDGKIQSRHIRLVH